MTLAKALKNLYHADFQERWHIAKQISDFGVIAIKPLREIVLDEEANLEYRWFALNILGEFRDVEVILTLVNLLEITEEDELIDLASNIFAKQGKSAINALSHLLNSSEYKLLAVKALAQIHSLEIVKPLLSIVKDENEEIRLMAIQALSNFSEESITQVLIETLKDYSSKVRKEALIGLALRVNSNLHLDITSLIAQLLYDVNMEVCQQAVISLSRIKSPLAISILVKELKNPSTPIPIQITIIRCLGWIQTEEILQYFNEALFFASKSAVIEIINILGRLEDKNLRPLAVEILLNFYNSQHLLISDSLVCKNLAYAWQQLGDKRSIKALIQLQNTDDNMVKVHANEALKKLMAKVNNQ